MPATPSPRPTGTATGSPSPTGPPPPRCEVFTPPTTPTGPTTCLAPLPLWHSRGYARATSGTLRDFEAEAVARCVDGRVSVMTGARFGIVGGLINNDVRRPNQPLDPLQLGLVETATVTFWETNWDPRTNTTTDGSDTVWVNALHIITPSEEIIVSHAEATAACPGADATGTGPSPPPGGFPRQVTLEPSKRTVLFSKTLTLAGAVTPATEFQTPRRCVEGVTVTIRRDVVGPPQRFVDVGRVQTDEDGHFAFSFEADRNALWLAFVERNQPTDCAQESSQAKPVLVKPFVKLRISDTTPRRNARIRFVVPVEPCEGHVGTRVKLKRVFQAHTVVIDQKRTNAQCRAIFRQRATYRTAVYQSAWPKQDDDHQTGKSRTKVVQTHR